MTPWRWLTAKPCRQVANLALCPCRPCPRPAPPQAGCLAATRCPKAAGPCPCHRPCCLPRAAAGTPLCLYQPPLADAPHQLPRSQEARRRPRLRARCQLGGSLRCLPSSRRPRQALRPWLAEEPRCQVADLALCSCRPSPRLAPPQRGCLAGPVGAGHFSCPCRPHLAGAPPSRLPLPRALPWQSRSDQRDLRVLHQSRRTGPPRFG